MFPRTTGSYLLGSFLVWATLLSQAAIAQETTRTVISPFTTMLKLALALIIVLLVFWLFARVMRQVQGSHTGTQLHGLRVVSTLVVGQRERVLVVQAGDQQLLLGVTGTQINKLHVFDKPISESVATSDPTDFRSKLSAALKSRVQS